MDEKKLWEFLENHLHAIFSGDFEAYKKTCVEDLGLYEWFVAPHRIDGLKFHEFMMKNNWAGSQKQYNIYLTNKRTQVYDKTAILSYTLILSTVDEKINHKVVNETRVIIEFEDGLKVVHVHKSPGK